ncbi:MAG: hypothetical protein HXS48_04745 [Theionarchaea archaeon]|nr:MAG: hypothetical protein AYK19_08525 [Theionarchaea archaeon DG-70-1]MBU7026229.1 hypothetical protein [Theionarchaea archaeon]
MSNHVDKKYYTSRKAEILALFDDHAQAWKPFLVSTYGDSFAALILGEAREYHEALIPEIPYIGGDKNPMTRHLVRSTTSLALYKAMEARGIPAKEPGKIIYDAKNLKNAVILEIGCGNLLKEMVSNSITVMISLSVGHKSFIM